MLSAAVAATDGSTAAAAPGGTSSAGTNPKAMARFDGIHTLVIFVVSVVSLRGTVAATDVSADSTGGATSSAGTNPKAMARLDGIVNTVAVVVCCSPSFFFLLSVL